MGNPRNSPISDPTPAFALPPAPKAPKVSKTDWAKLGANRKYKQVDTYIETRKAYWQHFLPGGEGIKDLVAAGKYEEAGKWAGLASIIVDELDTLQFRVAKDTK
jgi:hypothetical protein